VLAPGGATKAFDVLINFTTPFTFDPSSGDLLFDVRNISGGAGFHYLDAEVTGGDVVSRDFAGGSSATTGSLDTSGLVAQFTYTSTSAAAAAPVPAAAWGGLALMGVVGLSQLRRRKSSAL
jgi:MYXO-CTERM domain-containing protein